MTIQFNDKRLVARVLAGERRAAEEFFDHFYPRVYRFCLVRMKNEAASEDIAQETMIAALKGLDGYRGEAALFSWLCQISRYQMSAWIKKNRELEESVSVYEDTEELQRALESLGGQATAEEGIILNGLIQQTLDHLPPDHSKVLELKYINGFSVEEIATDMKTGKTAIQSLLARARRNFQHMFNELSAGMLDLSAGAIGALESGASEGFGHGEKQ